MMLRTHQTAEGYAVMVRNPEPPQTVRGCVALNKCFKLCVFSLLCFALPTLLCQRTPKSLAWSRENRRRGSEHTASDTALLASTHWSSLPLGLGKRHNTTQHALLMPSPATLFSTYLFHFLLTLGSVQVTAL